MVMAQAGMSSSRAHGDAAPESAQLRHNPAVQRRKASGGLGQGRQIARRDQADHRRVKRHGTGHVGRQNAIDMAESARIDAILSAFLLTAAALIAAVAAISGAVRGGRHRDEGRMFAGLSYRL